VGARNTEHAMTNLIQHGGFKRASMATADRLAAAMRDDA
jgi:hypothetical protein